MIPNRNDEPDPMAATRASGACSGIGPFSTKFIIITKTREVGGSGGGSTPPRAGRRARRPPPFQAAKSPLSPRLLEDCSCPLKGDIWLNSGHHLHLTNKGDLGTPGIVIVTSAYSGMHSQHKERQRERERQIYLYVYICMYTVSQFAVLTTSLDGPPVSEES